MSPSGCFVAELEREQLVARAGGVVDARRGVLAAEAASPSACDGSYFSASTSAASTFLPGGHDLVERRHRVPGADLAGVLRVVVEVLGRPACGSRSRSAGTRATCAGLNSTWIFTSLAIVTSVPVICSTSTLRASLQRVDVGVVAVALVGELLQRRVLEVAHAEAEHASGTRRVLAFSSISRVELALAGDADVEVAVGAEDHAVDAALDEVLAGDLVGELDARAAVGRAAGLRAGRARRGSSACWSPRVRAAAPGPSLPA